MSGSERTKMIKNLAFLKIDAFDHFYYFDTIVTTTYKFLAFSSRALVETQHLYTTRRRFLEFSKLYLDSIFDTRFISI